MSDPQESASEHVHVCVHCGENLPDMAAMAANSAHLEEKRKWDAKLARLNYELAIRDPPFPQPHSRSELAADLLCSMVSGLSSAQVAPQYAGLFIKGIDASPEIAVQLADSLLAALTKPVSAEEVPHE